ncbi:hypothetical protein Anapl_00627 [Anas platyrhynchos]|uniref:Uncharacterized protein n=1 Tax=Anas platyrhynchos TaxID=8839 RepID=R0LNQ0_ANAPL|nr:hypothetical protein Anapl_00627 [Anas platyrhynchos]
MEESNGVEQKISKSDKSLFRAFPCRVLQYFSLGFEGLFALLTKQKADITDRVCVSKLAEHKLYFPGTDYFKKFIWEYYADSKSVKNVNDGVTETTCIAHDVLGSKYQQEIAAVFQILISSVLDVSMLKKSFVCENFTLKPCYPTAFLKYGGTSLADIPEWVMFLSSFHWWFYIQISKSSLNYEHVVGLQYYSADPTSTKCRGHQFSGLYCAATPNAMLPGAGGIADIFNWQGSVREPVTS